ncbi:MAG TPA: protein-glutamate O-methyltransferase [Verrucomicrobiae bacterium]|nr:protein-glutamate O-methyltransferase [Verrucomicrobiae bacterium]
MNTTDAIDPRTFQKFCELIYEKAGIKLGPQKEALVSARVGKRMRSLGIEEFEEYYQFVRSDESGGELVELLNAISTNVTHFFREERHFELLEQILREWAAAGQTRFRVWCAASSTGEEPYSLAITLRESLDDLSDVKILATDISTKVLAFAREGVYEQKHIEKLPSGALARHFTIQRDASKGKVYCVNPELKRLLTFVRLNLAHPPFPMTGPFDVVFCRNVMIYFDNDVRRGLLSEAYRLLRPGGYLMVGHAESLSGMLSNFKSVEPSVYIKS